MPHYTDFEKETILKIWAECDTKCERERALQKAGITRSYKNVYKWVENNQQRPSGSRENRPYSQEENDKILHIFSTVKDRQTRIDALKEAGLGFRGYNPIVQQYNKLRRVVTTDVAIPIDLGDTPDMETSEFNPPIPCIHSQTNATQEDACEVSLAPIDYNFGDTFDVEDDYMDDDELPLASLDFDGEIPLAPMDYNGDEIDELILNPIM